MKSTRLFFYQTDLNVFPHIEKRTIEVLATQIYTMTKSTEVLRWQCVDLNKQKYFGC